MKAGLLEGVMGRYPTVDEEKEENGKWISISKVPEEQHRIRSIIDHLMRLFNTRCDSKEKSGYTGQRLSYGLPELTEFYRKDRNSIKKLRDAIEKAVTNYEPRLTQVEVIEQNVDSPDFSVAFLLKAQIIDETAHLRALFSTDGSASVTLVSGQQ
jgi:type VI secretion system lysozyme-like protein